MSLITKIFALLVALEFLYIFYLETLATASDKTAKVFGMTADELKRDSVNTLFKNQGVYNGLISVLILDLHRSGSAVRKPDQQSENHSDAGRAGNSDTDHLHFLNQGEVMNSIL